MKWADIPDSVKLTGVILAAASAVSGFAFTTFQTIEAAEYQQQTQAVELRAWRLQEIERQIKVLEFQLLSDDLTEAQKEFLRKEVQRLEKEKECVREGKC